MIKIRKFEMRMLPFGMVSTPAISIKIIKKILKYRNRFKNALYMNDLMLKPFSSKDIVKFGRPNLAHVRRSAKDPEPDLELRR